MTATVSQDKLSGIDAVQQQFHQAVVSRAQQPPRTEGVLSAALLGKHPGQVLDHGGIRAPRIGQRRVEPLEFVGITYYDGSLKDVGGLPRPVQRSLHVNARTISLGPTTGIVTDQLVKLLP